MTDTILNLFGRRFKGTPTHERVFNAACVEASRMRSTYELRDNRPAHITRAWCEDCRAVVELLGSGACACGSRSVVLRTGRAA